MKGRSTLVIWILAVTAVAAVFYAIDQSIMAGQGLPLDWLLRPAQS